MLASALGAIGNRLDAKFLTAFWLPAFVGALGCFGIVAMAVGLARIDSWVYSLDSVEQMLTVLIVVLTVTMGAFVLRALARPIAEAFAGRVLPQTIAAWSTRGQLRVREQAVRTVSASASPPGGDAVVPCEQEWSDGAFPIEASAIQPTRFGNLLAAAAEYPRFVYAMEGFYWWPRLSPLVPGEFQDMLGSAQAPMMGLLNLSVVFTTLALGGTPILILAGGHWTEAGVVLPGGLVLAWLCYRAAVSQAAELGSLLRVGFDLYRHEILRQMDIELPVDLETERTLWQQLTTDMLSFPVPDRIKSPGGGDNAT